MQDAESIRDVVLALKGWFPPEAHKERDLPGGGKWYFIPWQIIRERLDEVCPSWQVSYSEPRFVGDYCTITCTITIGGIARQGVGNAEIVLLSKSGKDMSRGTPIERATADAFKNAAEAWGVARYLDEQIDPKMKSDFIRYMQGRGRGDVKLNYVKNQAIAEGRPMPKISDPDNGGIIGKRPTTPVRKPVSDGIGLPPMEEAIDHSLELSPDGREALLDTVSKEAKRLGWDKSVGITHLQTAYQKSSKGELSDGELAHFVGWLSRQPSPVSA